MRIWSRFKKKNSNIIQKTLCTKNILQYKLYKKKTFDSKKKNYILVILKISFYSLKSFLYCMSIFIYNFLRFDWEKKSRYNKGDLKWKNLAHRTIKKKSNYRNAWKECLEKK